MCKPQIWTILGLFAQNLDCTFAQNSDCTFAQAILGLPVQSKNCPNELCKVWISKKPRIMGNKHASSYDG